MSMWGRVVCEELLAPLTTFRVGGPARYRVDAKNIEDIQEAQALAQSESLPLLVLGGGSNVLVPDEGVDGVVVRIGSKDISINNEKGESLIIADAGARWDDVVDLSVQEGLFGIENLAGIPGTVGGATAQNIGAYGAELSNVFAYADVFDTCTGEVRRVAASEASFGYRTSFFKEHRELIVMRVALRLMREAQPDIRYTDLARAHEQGVKFEKPEEIARAVREIRSGKLPDLRKFGTAGSFFKNPVVSAKEATALKERFSGLPLYPQDEENVKFSLAWLLDHALNLKGHACGAAHLYEQQPLVIVTHENAHASDVHALAEDVRARVYDAIGVDIEREVETFGA